MTKKEKALDYFSRKFHCSQSVLAAYADECGLTEEQALKLGGCFGGGMRKGEVCGACTGALLVLGTLYGQYDENDLKRREICNKVNVEMMERFAEKAGSYICNDILGYDITTSEGLEHIREEKLFTELCPKMVEYAMDVLEEIMTRYEHEKRLY